MVSAVEYLTVVLCLMLEVKFNAISGFRCVVFCVMGCGKKITAYHLLAWNRDWVRTGTCLLFTETNPMEDSWKYYRLSEKLKPKYMRGSRIKENGSRRMSSHLSLIQKQAHPASVWPRLSLQKEKERVEEICPGKFRFNPLRTWRIWSYPLKLDFSPLFHHFALNLHSTRATPGDDGVKLSCFETIVPHSHACHFPALASIRWHAPNITLPVWYQQQLRGASECLLSSCPTSTWLTYLPSSHLE